ncbi:MAG: bifunctional 2-polyprenyl-6-hydroxyphenol methylase/3-demethylubiquinol 3-O-methyltransferase UbiG [Frankia sp.]
MGVDNGVYDRLGATWWDPANPLVFLHSATAGRFSYFHDVLVGRLARSAGGLRALDIGCGGGFLAERFARSGCRVLGVDPSEVSVTTARRHAASEGLDIAYCVGVGERLPAGDACVDVAYCCDVLEHVANVDRVIAEIARVLKPGGVFFFDTLNRTWASKLVAIKIAQEWRPTRLVDFALHDWSMFITPAELADALGRHGMHGGEVVGFGPRARPTAVFGGLIRLRAGRISYGELGRVMKLGRVRNTWVSYMGFALKHPG